MNALWDGIKRIWGYELTMVEDRPIMISTVVIAFFLLIIGVFFSKIISRIFSKQVLERFHVPVPATAAFQTITFYILVLFFTFMALRIVNLPLTVFTLLGGAFAIGIGFGSQNIINNFISGLILLAERPIKVGDIVEIQGLYGMIEHIGARSTQIRSSENCYIIVPNSSFLQNNVLNWTLSDDMVRTSVKVGVMYGSPAREVERLIRKAIDEHGRVMKKPDPIILFRDFGESSLIFEAHFWIKMKRMMDRWMVESDLRYHIESLFREAGIVIAFPQRDVHIDSKKPVQVQVVRGENIKNQPVDDVNPIRR